MLKCLIAIAIRAKKGFSFLLPCGVARKAKPMYVLSLKRFEKISLFGSKILLLLKVIDFNLNVC